tara:strand:- start:22 stop:249 length:228 start_codon:yes stop_codon:yes gene_type:complete
VRAAPVAEAEPLTIEFRQAVDWLFRTGNKMMDAIEERHHTPNVSASFFIHGSKGINIIDEPNIEFGSIKQDSVLA